MLIRLPATDVFINEDNITSIKLEKTTRTSQVIIYLNDGSSVQYGPPHPGRRSAEASMYGLVNLLNIPNKSALTLAAEERESDNE